MEAKAALPYQLTLSEVVVRFDVYGRFRIEVCREADHWAAYRIAPGKRVRINDLVIPGELQTSREIARFLDDLYHEAARPGQSVSVIGD
jgi:hypothetical protein